MGGPKTQSLLPNGLSIDVVIFTMEDLISCAGAPAERVRNWIKRGFISPQSGHPGTGRSRMFSARDIMKAVFLNRMTDAGILVSKAAEHLGISNFQPHEMTRIAIHEYANDDGVVMVRINVGAIVVGVAKALSQVLSERNKAPTEAASSPSCSFVIC
jgi:DNA-binding transcriptional MerR regulator